MNNKIELFKIILERTELARVSFNKRAQLRYATKKYLKGEWTLKQLSDKAVQAKAIKDKLKAFTKSTTTRRRQLAHELKTYQHKSFHTKT